MNRPNICDCRDCKRVRDARKSRVAERIPPRTLPPLQPAGTFARERAEARTPFDALVKMPPALELTAPIPMRIVCPECGTYHVDEGEYATKPHHTHACQACGNVWRPAIVATVGVRFLPGFKNEPSEPACDVPTGSSDKGYPGV